MKGKWKYIIITIIILDVLYLIMRYWDRYEHQQEKKLYISNILENVDTLSIKKIESSFNYGDLIEDHILTDVNNQVIDVSKNRKKFKFINILQTTNQNKINVDHMQSFIEIKKEFIRQNIEFIFLIVGDLSFNKQKEFVELQKRFNINICTITQSLMKKLYRIPECHCGFVFLLDDSNKVRFSNYNIGYESLKIIINNELTKIIN